MTPADAGARAEAYMSQHRGAWFSREQVIGMLEQWATHAAERARAEERKLIAEYIVTQFGPDMPSGWANRIAAALRTPPSAARPKGDL